MKKWIAVIATIVVLVIAGGGISFFGFAKADPGDPVIDSLKAIGFNSREEFVAFFAMDIDPREVTVCPGEFACVRVLREKNMFAQIVPFHMTNPTDVMFDGWMEGPDFRAAFGRQSPPFPPEARGSGVPRVPDAFFGVWVEGITVRPFGLPPIGSGVAAPAQLAPSGSNFGDANSVRAMFGIDASVTVEPCQGESNCFSAIKRASNGEPQPFHLKTDHRLDGQLPNGSVGIPAGYNGNVMGATLRP